jgi:thiopurine S-methyltransferase
MDAEFWKERWQTNQIGWHEGRVSPMLAKHWPALGLPAGAKVFVPLCGKSKDMVWLAAQGHPVIGVELSEIAVAAFFSENGLVPQQQTRATHAISKTRDIEIWCGDFFALTPGDLSGAAAAYDRASLIAMPPSMQPAYAAKMAELLPSRAPVLLLTISVDEPQPSGPPFGVPPARVRELFAGAFTIDEIDGGDIPDIAENFARRGVTRLRHHVMLMRRI